MLDLLIALLACYNLFAVVITKGSKERKGVINLSVVNSLSFSLNILYILSSKMTFHFFMIFHSVKCSGNIFKYWGTFIFFC